MDQACIVRNPFSHPAVGASEDLKKIKMASAVAPSICRDFKNQSRNQSGSVSRDSSEPLGLLMMKICPAPGLLFNFTERGWEVDFLLLYELSICGL
jgi:hypothetical protein